MKIDALAHILTPNYYQKMLDIDPDIPDKYPFLKIKALTDIDYRLANWPDPHLKQVISFANLNVEDFVIPDQSADICRQANEEMEEIVKKHSDKFEAGVGMLPMNNIPAARAILQEISDSKYLVGAQIFTRHLGKSIAALEYRPVLAAAAKLNVPLWLHPVFDKRKPDNNLIFSWEYELSQAMLQLVQSDIFEEYPNLKILVHHAGAMVPFFSGRINQILDEQHADDFKNFYVDTAILGNPPTLQLTLDYFGINHVLYATDAPFGVAPFGADEIVTAAVEDLDISDLYDNKIFKTNYEHFVE